MLGNSDQNANSSDVVSGKKDVPLLLRRALAFIIDYCLIFGSINYLDTHFWIYTQAETARSIPGLLASMGMFVLVNLVFVYFSGKTPGCIITGIKIVSLKEPELSLFNCFFRNLVLIAIAIIYFPYFLIIIILITLFESRKDEGPYLRTAWDLVAKTKVIKSWK